MGWEKQQDDFNKDRAELFEALGHPKRIRILQILSDSPQGFSGLKKEVGIESNGLLSFHLSKLDGLVTTSDFGSYQLTDEGKEALRIMASKEPAYPQVKIRHALKPLHIVPIALGVALVILVALSLFNSQLQMESFNSLNQSYTDLNRNYIELSKNYDNLSNIFNTLMNFNSSSTVFPPISKTQAFLIALEHNGWTNISGYSVNVELYYISSVYGETFFGPSIGNSSNIAYNATRWNIICAVTTPVANYSTVATGNTTYHYAWRVDFISGGLIMINPNPQLPQGELWVDASTGNIIPYGYHFS